MAQSKKARDKWDAANLMTISCRTRRETALEFRRYCYEKGSSPHQELKEMVQAFIEARRAEIRESN